MGYLIPRAGDWGPLIMCLTVNISCLFCRGCIILLLLSIYGSAFIIPPTPHSDYYLPDVNKTICSERSHTPQQWRRSSCYQCHNFIQNSIKNRQLWSRINDRLALQRPYCSLLVSIHTFSTQTCPFNEIKMYRICTSNVSCDSVEMVSGATGG